MTEDLARLNRARALIGSILAFLGTSGLFFDPPAEYWGCVMIMLALWIAMSIRAAILFTSKEENQ